MTAVVHMAAEIEDLFCQGLPLEHIVAVGETEGCWSRADVLDVLREREWDLDGSGRLPRSKRVTTPRGLRDRLSVAPAPKKPAKTPMPSRFVEPDPDELDEKDEPLNEVDAPEPSPEPAHAHGRWCLVGCDEGGSEPLPPCSAQSGEPDPEPLRSSTNTYISAVQARDLGIDADYQRPLDEARVARMVAHWDPRMVGTLHVSDRGFGATPRYAVVDGKHRAVASTQVSPLGPDVWLACVIHEGLTVADEARLMRQLDLTRKKLSGFDHWRARRLEGDPVVAAVERIAATHGLRIDHSPGDGVVRSYATAEKLHKLGGDNLLDQALAVLRGAYDIAEASYQGPLLMAVGQLLHQAAGLDVERLTRALAANRPEKLRAAAATLRDEQSGPLYSLMASAITAAYNRTPGSGPRIAWSR